MILYLIISQRSGKNELSKIKFKSPKENNLGQMWYPGLHHRPHNAVKPKSLCLIHHPFFANAFILKATSLSLVVTAAPASCLCERQECLSILPSEFTLPEAALKTFIHTSSVTNCSCQERWKHRILQLGTVPSQQNQGLVTKEEVKNGFGIDDKPLSQLDSVVSALECYFSKV